jgi:ribonuclease D
LSKLSRDFPEYLFDKKRGVKLIELGAVAKAKNAVADGNASLASIVAVTLQQNLSKDTRSSQWTAPNLTEDQIEYAALDAWVTFPIWDVLKTQRNSGDVLQSASPVGQLVSLLSKKKR